MSATRFFFYLAIGMIPFGRLISEPVFQSAGKVVPLSPNDIILGVLILVYCMTCFIRSQPVFSRVPNYKVILLFPIWCSISLLLSMKHYGLSLGATLFSALYLMRWVAYSFFYFVAYDIAADRSTARKVAKWVFVGGLGFALFGIVQAAFLPDFALQLHPEALPFIDFDPQGHRLVSTFLDPNIAAGFIVILGLVAVSFCVHGFKRWIGPLFLFVWALAATLSRGGLLGFVIGTLFLLISTPSLRTRLLRVTLATLVLLLALYPLLRSQIEDTERFSITDASAMARLADWKLVSDVIIDRWITGIGFNTFGFVSPEYGIAREGALSFGFAGDLIVVLALTGLVGLGIYLWMCRGMLVSLARLGSDADNHWDRAFGRGVGAATIGVIASSFFTTLLLYPQIMAVLWVLWALGKRLQNQMDARAHLMNFKAVRTSG